MLSSSNLHNCDVFIRAGETVKFHTCQHSTFSMSLCICKNQLSSTAQISNEHCIGNYLTGANVIAL